MNKNQIWVLAEPETFFLPNLIDRLAQLKFIEGIIIVRFKKNKLKTLFSKYLKLYTLFGFNNIIVILISFILANLLNSLSLSFVYSLKKVARRNNIPYFTCKSFYEITNLLHQQKVNKPIFVQVSRKVPESIYNNYFLINKHCAILPKYAGIYPVYWIMLNQEPYQGVTIHRMDKDFDQGEILMQDKIINNGSFFQIYDQLYDLSYTLIKDILEHPLSLSKTINKMDLNGYSYYTYPTSLDVKRFETLGLRFGCPFRIRRRPLIQ